ncbi:MAG: DUF4139 domain-containing protein [Deltaproteobacteria bacterium]|nr:DUF4139 domain-containing protein [Deltaproteobacteria bacterium]
MLTHVLLTAVWVGAVPKVPAGPDLADRATAVDAPIETVQVFSDRARVTRRAKLTIPAGVTAVRLPDLPGATWLDTVRATGNGVSVLRVEAIPVTRDRYSIEQVEILLNEVEALTDELALIDAKLQSLGTQYNAVNSLRPTGWPAEKDRKAPIRWDVGGWSRVLELFASERDRLAAERRGLETVRRDKARALAKKQLEIQRMNLGAFSDQKVQVLLLLEADRVSGGTVDLSYDIPGAFWKPAYDLRYDAKKGEVALETYGVVSQATGEAWPDVSLVLSTGVPGRDIALPSLLTWTLGEAKEFIPRVRARTSPSPAPRYAPPQPAADVEAQARAARQALLQRRMNELLQLARMDTSEGRVGAKLSDSTSSYSFDDALVDGVLVANEAAKAESTRLSAPSRPPAPAPASPAPRMRVAEEYAPVADVEVESVVTTGQASSGSMFGGRSERVVNTPLSLFEAPVHRGPSFSDPDLPAMSAGGFEHVFTARTKMTVPSTGEQLRAPLGRSVFPVTAFYEAAPALAPNAYLKASVKNATPRPILRGPVTIFVNEAFAGDGRLETTGTGGTLMLPFGADEDIKLVRKVLPTTETQGVFSKDEVTTYRVILEVANYKKRPVTVVLREPFPASRHEKVEIELVKVSPEPAEKTDDGIWAFRMDIAAGRTQAVELVYRIRRPDGWQLQQ